MSVSNTSTPDRKRYPWLDDAGDEEKQENVFSTSQTSLPPVDGNKPSPSRESTLNTELQDKNPDEISLDDEEEEGVNDEGEERVNDEGLKVNPAVGEKGVNDEGSKVKPAVVIKRRNMALYQSHEQDD